VIILDTNVWIFGITKRRERCTDLIRDISYGRDDECRVSAYIYEEVRTNLGRSNEVESGEVDRLIERFAMTIETSDNIVGPTSERISRTNVRAERTHPANITLARTVEIQAKDAPIVAFAYMQHENRQLGEQPDPIEIITTDGAFGDLDPKAHNLPLEVSYL
jgi:predicted nucleic acid-binding protein